MSGSLRVLPWHRIDESAIREFPLVEELWSGLDLGSYHERPTLLMGIQEVGSPHLRVEVVVTGLKICLIEPSSSCDLPSIETVVDVEFEGRVIGQSAGSADRIHLVRGSITLDKTSLDVGQSRLKVQYAERNRMNDCLIYLRRRIHQMKRTLSRDG